MYSTGNLGVLRHDLVLPQYVPLVVGVAVMINESIHRFLRFQCLLQLWHWQSILYSQHEAFGSCSKKMTKLCDRWVEHRIGDMGSLPTSSSIPSFSLVNFGLDAVRSEINTFLAHLHSSGDERLKAIEDEMAEELYKLLYLLRLQ